AAATHGLGGLGQRVVDADLAVLATDAVVDRLDEAVDQGGDEIGPRGRVDPPAGDEAGGQRLAEFVRPAGAGRNRLGRRQRARDPLADFVDAAFAGFRVFLEQDIGRDRLRRKAGETVGGTGSGGGVVGHLQSTPSILGEAVYDTPPARCGASIHVKKMRDSRSIDRPALEAGDRTAGAGGWATIRSLLPYLWAWRGRVVAALACLVAAKLATVGVPILLKHVVDALDPAIAGPELVVPVALVVLYGLLRFATTLFTELREVVFASVTERAVRRISGQVFEHLHSLALRFHLERRTGGLTRDIERGTRGITALVSYTLYSILPTLVEIGLVLGYLVVNYEADFALITIVALVLYAAITFTMTEWRTRL